MGTGDWRWLLFAKKKLYIDWMEESGKIVVFKAFDNVINANLAKTKLDAYGIPCFLTEENFTNLYPLMNDIFPGVRLHVFKQDFDQAKEVLQEEIEWSQITPKNQTHRIDTSVLDYRGSRFYLEKSWREHINFVILT